MPSSKLDIDADTNYYCNKSDWLIERKCRDRLEVNSEEVFPSCVCGFGFGHVCQLGKSVKFETFLAHRDAWHILMIVGGDGNHVLMDTCLRTM